MSELCQGPSATRTPWCLCRTFTGAVSESVFLFLPFKTHFWDTCRGPKAEHLYFLTVFKGYEEKEGARTDRHTSLIMSVFFKKARGKKTDQALFFLVGRRDNFLVMIQHCHMESMTVLYTPHSFAFKTLLMTTHLSR